VTVAVMFVYAVVGTVMLTTTGAQLMVAVAFTLKLSYRLAATMCTPFPSWVAATAPATLICWHGVPSAVQSNLYLVGGPFIISLTS
jgi:hypothetical protein